MDVVQSSPPLGSGGYKKWWLPDVGAKRWQIAPSSHQRQMVDDAGWTSFEALHRLAAVATRSGGYKRKGCKKEARDRPEKKRPGRWSWPLENFRRYFDPNH
jgi:hypothetical protein